MVPYRTPEKQATKQVAWRTANPEKVLAQNKRHYDADPERSKAIVRKSQLKRWYGLTPEDYDALLEKQNGVCAICKQVCVSGRRLAVDHDHITGKVRGLLCCKCNRGLGNFGDDVSRIKQALEYLQ